MVLDINYIIDNWPLMLAILILVRNFINNLLNDCPHIKSNKTMELIQAIFNALVKTTTIKNSEVINEKSNETVNRSARRKSD
jgi:hypothetical protein